jgi:hypothetical protein
MDIERVARDICLACHDESGKPLQGVCVCERITTALETLEAEIKALREQVKHLSGGCGLCHPAEHEEKISLLESRCERYRKALEWISKFPCHHQIKKNQEDCNCETCTAKSALKEGDQNG